VLALEKIRAEASLASLDYRVAALLHSRSIIKLILKSFGHSVIGIINYRCF